MINLFQNFFSHKPMVISPTINMAIPIARSIVKPSNLMSPKQKYNPLAKDNTNKQIKN